MVVGMARSLYVLKKNHSHRDLLCSVREQGFLLCVSTEEQRGKVGATEQNIPVAEPSRGALQESPSLSLVCRGGGGEA